MNRLFTASLALIAAGSLSSLASAGDIAPIRLASVSSTGAKGTLDSYRPHMSGDGRYVVFESSAPNLALGGGGGKTDIFLRDLHNQTTVLVSSNSVNGPSNGSSLRPKISPDGRFIVFASDATNLIAGDTNGFQDIFIREIKTTGLGPTERVSVSSSEQQADNQSKFSSVSNDGRYVAFDSDATNLVGVDANGKGDVFIRDRFNGTTEVISNNQLGTGTGNDSSLEPQISGNGDVVVFTAKASDLVSGDINGAPDVFGWDRAGGSVQRLSVDSTGSGAANGSSTAPSISDNGNVVAFLSDATNISPDDINGNLPDIFVRERGNPVTELASSGSSNPADFAPADQPTISGDGKIVSFSAYAVILPGIYSAYQNFYARNRAAKETVVAARAFDGSLPSADVNITSGGEAGPGSSSDGRLLSFTTGAVNMTGPATDPSGDQDVFVSQIHFAADDVQPTPSTSTDASSTTADVASVDSTTAAGTTTSSTTSTSKFTLTARLSRYVRYTNSHAMRKPLIVLRSNHAFKLKAGAYLSAKTKAKGKTKWVTVAKLAKSASTSSGRLDIRLTLTKKGKKIFASLKKGKSLAVRIMALKATSTVSGEVAKITKKSSTMRRTVRKSSKK